MKRTQQARKASSGQAELAISDALVVDGTGAAPFQGGVRVRDGKIVAVAKAPLPANFANGAEQIDAGGLALTPGFIDAHGHSDLSAMAAPEVTGKLSQGVTAEIAGNCGASPFPLTDVNREHLEEHYRHYGLKLEWSGFAGYAKALAKREPSINFGLLCGHNAVRGGVRGYGPGEASPTELAAMRKLLREALAEGALGMSSGLFYVPGKFADRKEMAAMLAELAAHPAADGAARPYATHMRSEGEGLLEALDETIGACLDAGHRKLQVSHLKTAGEKNWGKLDATFLRISQARERGLEINADRYPYTASMTTLSAYLPSPWNDLDDTTLTAKLADQAAAAQLQADLEKLPTVTWERMRLISAGPGCKLSRPGAKIAELAKEMNRSPAEICVAALRAGSSTTMAAREGMCEENLKRILAQPWVCGGSDGRALPRDGSLGLGHPRAYGALVRHLKLILPEFGLGEAVRRLTSFPATIFNLAGRGRIAPGMAADLVLFDPNRLADRADFANPFLIAEGIDRVWVNGTLAWQDGQATGRRAGRVLRETGRE